LARCRIAGNGFEVTSYLIDIRKYIVFVIKIGGVFGPDKVPVDAYPHNGYMRSRFIAGCPGIHLYVNPGRFLIF
jgi:hypothetical protein